MCKQTKSIRLDRYIVIVNLFNDHDYHLLDRSLRKIILIANNLQYIVNRLVLCYPHVAKTS